MHFADLKLIEPLLRAIAEEGYAVPTPVQAQAIPHVLAGRDLLLTRSADAIIIGCGRVGTIHEFTVAYEDSKPIGVLEGGWTTDDTIKEIIARSNRTRDKIIFESDPKVLVEKLIALVKKDKVSDDMTYSYRPTEE